VVSFLIKGISIPQDYIQFLILGVLFSLNANYGGESMAAGQRGERSTFPLRSTMIAWTSGKRSRRAKPSFGPSTKVEVAKASASMAEGAMMVTLWHSRAGRPVEGVSVEATWQQLLPESAAG